ncbi:MAG: hypothetical protein WDM86_17745 [Rhizomicrobium sp.]
MPSTVLRYLFIGSTLAALCVAAAIPIALWGSDKAPEFYGAFTAAIVAAVAVVLGAYYQDELTRRRDDILRKQDATAEAIDLCFWLEHAANEVEFIANLLAKTREHLVADDASRLEMPIEQFREVMSAKFFAELLPRAKMAAHLPAEIAGTVVQAIYRTFHVADRILMLRGASNGFHPTLEQIDSYLLILDRRSKKLHEAATLIEDHLNGIGALNSIGGD